MLFCLGLNFINVLDREELRLIFNNPNSPVELLEHEFDGFDDKLKKLSLKHWKDITADDLSSYYLLNLIYNTSLQKDLFDYLFPVCVAVWKEELMTNSESNFTDEIYRVFKRQYIWDEMIDSSQKSAIYSFLVRSILERISAEQNFDYIYNETPVYALFNALNDLNNSLPLLEDIWKDWWLIDNKGKAVFAVMYCSRFVYGEMDNPIFLPYSKISGGGPPEISLPQNKVNSIFLKNTLSVDFILTHLELACQFFLRSDLSLYFNLASQITHYAKANRDIIKSRIDDYLIKVCK